MKSLLTIVGFVLVLLVISVFSKIIGGVAGEHLAKSKIASDSAQTERAQEAANSGWIYTHKTNPMTGAVTKTAFVGDREIRLERFSTSTGDSGLRLWAKSSRVCSDRRKCHVLVRFDDQEPKRFPIRYYGTVHPHMAEFESPEMILSSLPTAARMRISREPYREGDDFLEFNVSGFDETASSTRENEADIEDMHIEVTPEEAADWAVEQPASGSTQNAAEAAAAAAEAAAAAR